MKRTIEEQRAALREEIREGESLVAWANDPTNARKLLNRYRATLVRLERWHLRRSSSQRNTGPADSKT